MTHSAVIVKSKFQILYFSKQIVGAIVGLITISLCLYNSFENGVINTEKPLFTVGIIATVLFLLFLFEVLHSVFEIEVIENGIFKINFLTRKKIFISFKDIDTTKIIGTGITLVNRPLEDEKITGPDAFVIVNNNGAKIFITPREYSNCQELVNAISTRHNSL